MKILAISGTLRSASINSAMLRAVRQLASARMRVELFGGVGSPEYAHGVTGTIKNALDWLVSFEPFVFKPVALLNASPRAHHADDAKRETLRTMSAIIVERASISIPLPGANLDDHGMIAHPEISRSIRGALEALFSHVATEAGT